jgi:hypothetical protein|tara:strand:+ start:160 stop:789 length:630 start_codon:yes stop_codon:yes gene_type:complete
MERIDLIKNWLDKSAYKKQSHFIGSWNIRNDDLCKQIINFFEENKILQKKGTSGSGVDETTKKTTDITISPNDLKNDEFKCFNNYMDELYKCFIDYQHQWPFMKNMIKNLDIRSFNVQKYLKGDHFSKVHTERANLQHSDRVFAWMTYLNNVEDGGATNFLHYDISVKPEIGKTLIWPAEWTHAHNGRIVNSGKKYIITGWMNFTQSTE